MSHTKQISQSHKKEERRQHGGGGQDRIRKKEPQKVHLEERQGRWVGLQYTECAEENIVCVWGGGRGQDGKEERKQEQNNQVGGGGSKNNLC